MSNFSTAEFNYFYIRPSKTPEYGWNFDAVGVGEYEPSSVLAGQERICFLDGFETVEEAEEFLRKEHGATDIEYHGPFTAPRNTFDHLPDEPDYGYNW